MTYDHDWNEKVMKLYPSLAFWRRDTNESEVVNFSSSLTFLLSMKLYDLFPVPRNCGFVVFYFFFTSKKKRSHVLFFCAKEALLSSRDCLTDQIISRLSCSKTADSHLEFDMMCVHNLPCFKSQYK